MARSNGKTAFLGNCGNKFLLVINDKKAFHQMAKRYYVAWLSIMAIWYSEELVPMRYCEECKGIVAIMYSADWMVISCSTEWSGIITYKVFCRMDGNKVFWGIAEYNGNKLLNGKALRCSQKGSKVFCRMAIRYSEKWMAISFSTEWMFNMIHGMKEKRNGKRVICRINVKYDERSRQKTSKILRAICKICTTVLF